MPWSALHWVPLVDAPVPFPMPAWLSPSAVQELRIWEQAGGRRSCAGAVSLVAIHQFCRPFPSCFPFNLFSFKALNEQNTAPWRVCLIIEDVKPSPAGLEVRLFRSRPPGRSGAGAKYRKGSLLPQPPERSAGPAQARIDAALGCGDRLRDSRPCLETLICTCRRLARIEP